LPPGTGRNGSKTALKSQACARLSKVSHKVLQRVVGGRPVDENAWV